METVEFQFNSTTWFFRHQSFNCFFVVIRQSDLSLYGGIGVAEDSSPFILGQSARALHWISHRIWSASDSSSLQQSTNPKCLQEQMTITNVRALQAPLLVLFSLPFTFLVFLHAVLILVLFPIQSSIKFASRSKQTLPVRARQQIALAASTAAVHSASVIVASSGRTFATSTIVFHFIFCGLSSILSAIWIIKADTTLCLILSSHRTLTPQSKKLLTALTCVPSSIKLEFHVAPFFSCHMCETISFLIPISVDVLEHVQMISHRPHVSLVRHVLRLSHHRSEFLIVDLPFAIHPIHNQI